MRVALFATCLGDQFFAEGVADAVRLLRSLDVEVGVPPAQTCCGQPAHNAGRPGPARRMAEHTLSVFRDADAVVLPSGSCAAMLRTVYGGLLGEPPPPPADGDGSHEAGPFQGRAFELAEFLVRVLGVEGLGDGLAGVRVAFHHGCHGLRELGLDGEATGLLRAAGAEVVAWESERECCGFGGLFSVKLPEVSAAMADRKLDTLPPADVLTSSDGGCLLQLAGRAARRGVEIPVRPLASLLWEARSGRGRRTRTEGGGEGRTPVRSSPATGGAAGGAAGGTAAARDAPRGRRAARAVPRESSPPPVRSRHYRELATQILERTPAVRDAVTRGALNLDARRRQAWAEVDAEAWRRWAEAVKNHLLSGLDRYLEEVEARLTARGVRVHWAEGPGDVHGVVREIVDRHGVRTAVKGKSMVSEELGLDGCLEARGVRFFETDLGEYIIQLLGEPPSHIIAPAIHRDLHDVRSLFARELGTPADASPEALAAVARAVLREAFLGADLGITGGNFLVAETGTLALIENEGNIRLSTSLPRVHLAVVGIEKLLPRWSDLAGFLQLTSRSATGQPLGTYVSLIQGPGGGSEPDGPEEVHVVLVDHGRSRVLADPEAWETLRCVRCAACLNACPVYRQTGGHAYGWVYGGPIGAVLAPGLLGLEETATLPQASSLCGACFEACPVRIPIPRLLVTWRRRAAEQGLTPVGEGGLLEAYGRVMGSPRLYRAATRALRVLPERLLDAEVTPVVGAWARFRAGLRPSPKSFLQLWKEGIP